MNDLARAIHKVVYKLQTDMETGDRYRHVEVKDLCDVLMAIADEVSPEPAPEAKEVPEASFHCQHAVNDDGLDLCHHDPDRVPAISCKGRREIGTCPQPEQPEPEAKEVAGKKSPCSHRVPLDGVVRCDMSGIGADSPLTSCEELKGRHECPVKVHEPTEQSYLDTKPLNWKDPEQPAPEAKPEHQEWADKANAAELRCDWHNAGRSWRRAAVACRDDSKASAYRDYAGRCETKCSEEPGAPLPNWQADDQSIKGNLNTPEAKPLEWGFTDSYTLRAESSKVYDKTPHTIFPHFGELEASFDGSRLAIGGLTACIAACEKHEAKQCPEPP